MTTSQSLPHKKRRVVDEVISTISDADPHLLNDAFYTMMESAIIPAINMIMFSRTCKLFRRVDALKRVSRYVRTSTWTGLVHILYCGIVSSNEELEKDKPTLSEVERILRDILAKTNGLVAGSSVLQALLGERWHGTDLDIWTTRSIDISSIDIYHPYLSDPKKILCRLGEPEGRHEYERVLSRHVKELIVLDRFQTARNKGLIDLITVGSKDSDPVGSLTYNIDLWESISKSFDLSFCLCAYTSSGNVRIFAPEDVVTRNGKMINYTLDDIKNDSRNFIRIEKNRVRKYNYMGFMVRNFTEFRNLCTQHAKYHEILFDINECTHGKFMVLDMPPIGPNARGLKCRPFAAHQLLSFGNIRGYILFGEKHLASIRDPQKAPGSVPFEIVDGDVYDDIECTKKMEENAFCIFIPVVTGVNYDSIRVEVMRKR